MKELELRIKEAEDRLSKLRARQRRVAAREAARRRKESRAFAQRVGCWVLSEMENDPHLRSRIVEAFPSAVPADSGD